MMFIFGGSLGARGYVGDGGIFFLSHSTLTYTQSNVHIYKFGGYGVCCWGAVNYGKGREDNI